MTASPTLTKHLSAARPFFFNTSAHLLRITEYKANTLSELLDALRECPEDSIFQHTFRTLEEHHFLREAFSNDFAQWVLTACNMPRLAERFAGVDVREFTSGRNCGNDSSRSWRTVCERIRMQEDRSPMKRFTSVPPISW